MFLDNASKRVEVSPGANVVCSVVHVPITCDELCFVNAKAGLGLSFNVFKQSYEDGVINSLSITNKSESPRLSNAANKSDLCILWKLSKSRVTFLNTSNSSSILKIF